MQVASRSDNQRVDFKQSQVFFFKQLGQTQEDLGELLNLLAFQTQFECQLTALVRLSTDQRIDFAFRIFSGVSSATFSISTPPSVEAMKTIRRVATVNNRAQVQLLVDVGAGIQPESC